MYFVVSYDCFLSYSFLMMKKHKGIPSFVFRNLLFFLCVLFFRLFRAVFSIQKLVLKCCL